MLNLSASINSISCPYWIIIILGFLLAFGITWVIIPSIVHISKTKSLCVPPNGRTSHSSLTPTLGGVAIFIGFVLSTVIISGTHQISELRYILAGLIIIFFMGIKDDILIIDPLKKLAGQIIAAIIITALADIRITNLYGLFHVGQLPYIISILLTVFVLIIIINGFNLIDGIDGLASGTGILTASVFGIWFWISGNIEYAIFSFAFVGSLIAFFCLNVFGKTNKIFLGDTGSMVTGFVMGVLACRFLQCESVAQGVTDIQSTPTVVCGILILPLFDSWRVFFLRIFRGKSPFKADHQHLHHRLLQLGCTHLQATLILLFVNLFFIVLSYLLQGIGIIWLMGLILGLATLMSFILVTFAKLRTRETIKYYYTFAQLQELTKRIKRIKEQQPLRNFISHSLEKITAGLN